jgi:RNA recognition motif-containing protein
MDNHCNFSGWSLQTKNCISHQWSMTKHINKRKVEENEHESSDDTENKEIKTSEPPKKKSRICNVQQDGFKHMIWVKNIDPKTPRQTLLKELSKFGEIQGSHFSKPSEKQLLQAHINFKTESAAYASLELNNTVFDGVTIEVKLGKDGAKRAKVVQEKERRQREKKAQKIQKKKEDKEKSNKTEKKEQTTAHKE